MLRHVFVAAAVLTCTLAVVFAAQQDTFNPKVYGPSEEGRKAMARLSLPKGTVATLFAAEPMLANPVCFCFDEQGNVYVAETFRLNAGVTDNRKHMKTKKSWLDDEISCLTVADRVAMYQKHYGKDFEKITTTHHER